jgi:hypothetical protein
VRRDGRVIHTPTGLPLYATPQLLALEEQILATVAAGFDTDRGVARRCRESYWQNWSIMSLVSTRIGTG